MTPGTGAGDGGQPLPAAVWDGPVFGRVGVLAAEGERVQCHACGRWFRSLASHAVRAHRLAADEYRLLFGLRARTGLVGPALRDLHRRHAERHLRPYWPRAADLARAQTPAERAARKRGHRWPAEAMQDPAHARLAAENGARLGAWTRAQQAAGSWRRPQPREPSVALAKARARWCELIADPAYRAAHGAKISAAKGGRVLVACATCGRSFPVRRSVAAAGRRRFCGPECHRTFLRQWGRAVGPRARAAQPRAARVCAVCGAGFAGVPNARYCSRACARRAAVAARPRAPAVCAACGAGFAAARGQRYCSPTCAVRAAQRAAVAGRRRAAASRAPADGARSEGRPAGP